MNERIGEFNMHGKGRSINMGRGRGRGRGRGVARPPFTHDDEQGMKEERMSKKEILTKTVIKPESDEWDDIKAVMEIAQLPWAESKQTRENTVDVEENNTEDMSVDGSGGSDEVAVVGVKPSSDKPRRGWQDSFESSDDEDGEGGETQAGKGTDEDVQKQQKSKRKQDEMKEHAMQKISPDKAKTPKRDAERGRRAYQQKGEEESGGREEKNGPEVMNVAMGEAGNRHENRRRETDREETHKQDAKDVEHANGKNKREEGVKELPKEERQRRATTHARVVNVYKKTLKDGKTNDAEETEGPQEATTPTTQNGQRKAQVSYAAAAQSRQSKLITHEKTKEAYDGFYEVTVHTNVNEQTPREVIIKHYQRIVNAIITRAKEVDRKAKVNTWEDESNLPTIGKPEDVPSNIADLRAYLAPERKGQTLGPGRNRCRVRITTHITRDEFVHYWSMSKRSFTKVEYIALRMAPLQHDTFHAAGFFLNSSDGQLVNELERRLTDEMGFKVGVSYRPAALAKRAANELWRNAKQAKQNAPGHEQERVFFRNAPFAQQVYAPTRKQAHEAALHLSEKYGSPDMDGQYPMLPDGSRMRFVPAGIYLDMQGQATAATLFPQQIQFQNMEVVAPIPIRDPQQKFPTQDNKTMQQLILDLKDPEMADEPYFRHLKRRFHWNYKTKEYEVSIHGQMYSRAAQILRQFKQKMTEMYGDEVGDAIMDQDTATETDRSTANTRDGTMSGISLATEDRYLNGLAKFIITGIEKVQVAEKEQTLQDIRKTDDDTMNVKSTASGLTGNTGNTVPEPTLGSRSTEVGGTENSTIAAYSHGWTRYGSAEDESRLAKEITQTPDPGGKTRARYP